VVLDTAMARGTNRVGRLLAPMGVRHIIVAEQVAPAPFVEATIPAQGEVLRMLSEQLDLERVEVREGMTVYRNTSWTPLVAELQQGTATQISSPTAAEVTGRDLSDVPARFTPTDARTWTGRVNAGTEVHFGVAQSSQWKLDSGTRSVASARGYGWANAYPVASDGEATLTYETSWGHRLVTLGFMALWALAIGVVVFSARFDRPTGAGRRR